MLENNYSPLPASTQNATSGSQLRWPRRSARPHQASRRRSKSYSSEFLESSNPHEVTPLLLTARLNELLRAPIDHGKKVCVVFFYLGMCTMLPWNFLISISAFWNYKFRQIGNDTGWVNENETILLMSSNNPIPVPIIKPTDMQVSFPSYVAIASNVPGAITTLLHSGFGQRVSVCTRMGWALSLLFVSFCCLLALSTPNSDLWQEKFLHLVLMLIVLANVGVNVLQGSMFGISGRFPPLYAGAVMMGQAMGGVVPSLVSIALISFEVEPCLLGPACFGAILLLLVLAMGFFHWMKTDPFFLYFAEGKDNHGVVEDHDAQVDQLCYKAILGKCWTYLLAGYINYSTTLMIFPALTSTVESMSNTQWSKKFFTPVAVVLLFNVCDLIGRILSTVIAWPKRTPIGKYGFLFICMLRIGLIPLFMVCNAKPNSRTLPLILGSDISFCTLVGTLALSVGYLGNHCLTNAPKTCDDAESQEASSLMLTATFVLGQASGSFLSYFVLKSI